MTELVPPAGSDLVFLETCLFLKMLLKDPTEEWVDLRVWAGPQFESVRPLRISCPQEMRQNRRPKRPTGSKMKNARRLPPERRALPAAKEMGAAWV